MTERIKTSEAIARAATAWKRAPLHIQAMAGSYVMPLLSALAAISDELALHRTELDVNGKFLDDLANNNNAIVNAINGAGLNEKKNNGS